ncbi:MAG: SprT family zinc-dependent metalloprotease [Desulfotomaculaceae bacterium]|nr:SprT family zinc-dependent metalloprotease [Desulfotomaculaceae bacterium]
MKHTFSNETIDYALIYKKRKTMGIYIDSYGHVEVQVPKETPEEKVLQLLEVKWDCIQRTTKEMKERMVGQQEKVYEHGEVFQYSGNDYPIEIIEDISVQQDHVTFKGDKLIIYVKQHEDERVRQALKRFYYQMCKSLVERRIRFYQSSFKLKPRSIKISDSKSRWGTCDSKLQLTFNWKLAMAPLEVIDYIVVHEMCHMVHLNHDRSFWRLVGKILPDYEELQNWLAQSSWKMNI